IVQGKFFEEDILTWAWPSHASHGPLPLPEDEGLIYAALKLALKDYVTKNNFPGVLLGLSGGVDSALVATLAVDALGPARVRAVMLPSEFTSHDSKDDARALADNLNITLETISIEPAVQALKTTMPVDAPPVTFENIQSRARGVILMGLSNASGALLLSTGNKSEMATGYATLYGDMCGGFNPLKDVYKTLVYKLCAWRNAQGMVIPQRILTKAPTAELKANQKDQDTLPPYDVLDEILHGLIEEDLGIGDLAARGHDLQTVERVSTLLKRAEYKRRQSAPGPKITTRAFGRDRRYPMTNRFLY
ncbi:MAG: NAD(+) synthase, partial [Alphaproteobacteria bacterium]|nr:NAD(+) synthase [Alphaproteobacteria bacterium]